MPTFESERALLGYLKLSTSRSFGSGIQGFDELASINLIVGQNNAGKSSMIDVVETIVTGDGKGHSLPGREGRQATVYLSTSLTEADLRPVFSESQAGGGIHGNHWRFGSEFLHDEIHWSIGSSARSFEHTGRPIPQPRLNTKSDEFFDRVVPRLHLPLNNLRWARIRSDRDIVPESAPVPANVTTNLDHDGGNATVLYRLFSTAAEWDRSIIGGPLLETLNYITRDDFMVGEIMTRQHTAGAWEIYFDECHSGLVPLSACGSGLRTILLVLANVFLVPAVGGFELPELVMAVEEPENNLHPALQRRLADFLCDLADSGMGLFMTTHAPAVIDTVAQRSGSQVLHVTREGGESIVRTALHYNEAKAILEDIGTRASDLLQANGVIWVEGPSDRVYIRRWLKLVDPTLIEGRHYQVSFYGGSLLAHASANLGTDPEGFVELLRINRNCIVVADSDRAKPSDALNPTKKRILKEADESGSLVWITEGREIENYIARETLRAGFEDDHLPALGRYHRIENYLTSHVAKNEGTRFLKAKTKYAHKLAEFMTAEGQAEVLDWRERMLELRSSIRQWNGMVDADADR